MKKFNQFFSLVVLVLGISSNVTLAQNNYLTSPHAFLQLYSNTLLNGNYIDHANLYWDPTFFGGRWQNAASIRKIAKNFYSKFQTLQHSFSVDSYGFDNEGYLVTIVLEYQKVKNRSTGLVTETTTAKRIKLFFWKTWYCYSQEELQWVD